MYSKFTINIPATTANIGPGFDCLGMALDLWNKITVEKGFSEFTIKGYGENEDVLTMAMVESPRFCWDDVSDEPERLIRGIADTRTAMGSWNMHARSDMVVAMSPQHAEICDKSGWSREDVHTRLIEVAGRTVSNLKLGGNWRRERALALPIPVDPDDSECFVPTIKNSVDLQLIVAGGWGPCTAVCHGWSGGSRAVHSNYGI